MKTSVRFGHWERTTIDRAIAIKRLIRITRSHADVELRSPARICPECRQPVEVVVVPGQNCASCWSRKVIGSWQVLPGDGPRQGS